MGGNVGKSVINYWKVTVASYGSTNGPEVLLN